MEASFSDPGAWVNLGFELTSEAAKPKRATEDAPAQASMRRQKLRRNPDADQKKARRQLRRKTASDAEFDSLVAEQVNENIIAGIGEEDAIGNVSDHWIEHFPGVDSAYVRRAWEKWGKTSAKTATPEEDLEDMWGPGSVQCPLCGGDGTKVDGTRCPMCMGDGKVTRARAASLRLRADTGPVAAPPRNPHDLGNEPIGHLPGAPIMENGGEGGNGWGYVPYPSYGEGGDVNISYVDEHGHRPWSRMWSTPQPVRSSRRGTSKSGCITSPDSMTAWVTGTGRCSIPPGR
jgi:hypothetical protein